MKKILNYKLTDHFETQMNKRRIDPLLISMCLAKGKMIHEKKGKIMFTLSKEQIETAIDLGYIKVSEVHGIYELCIIARNKILITTYAKYADTGIF